MTGFIEVNCGDVKVLINVATIRYVQASTQGVGRSVIRFDSEAGSQPVESRCVRVDHPYDDVVQLLLKTDVVALGR